ncbi:MAG: hypothetical protein GTN76_15495 [Candidatus Aenigmarchaeota archaeon]|nr:hypothetical protein [bacterium]NIO22087.1 hypothetical protein [Candidatus Aenigmarchaeota archaeon]
MTILIERPGGVACFCESRKKAEEFLERITKHMSSVMAKSYIEGSRVTEVEVETPGRVGDRLPRWKKDRFNF